MNPPTTLPKPRPRRSPAESPRQRNAFPALWPDASPLRPATAAHDFLVPNPRADLTTDLRTLRMIEAG